MALLDKELVFGWRNALTVLCLVYGTCGFAVLVFCFYASLTILIVKAYISQSQ